MSPNRLRARLTLYSCEYIEIDPRRSARRINACVMREHLIRFLGTGRPPMFDAQCDIAAVVYGESDDPDALLRDFAADLNARGQRAIGIVQAGQCADSSLSAMLVHNGETLLLAQDPDPTATGCRLDLGRLSNAAERIAADLGDGADLLVVNRFGKREAGGKGLASLIDRALNADIPVVIAVSSERFADWVQFAGGMSVKLKCDRQALDAWWHAVSSRAAVRLDRSGTTVCEILK